MENWTLKHATRIGVLEQLTRGVITTRQASQQLNLSRRHLFRLKSRFANLGHASVRHGNHSRRPVNKTSDLVRKKALKAFTQWRHTCDVAPNCSHFRDILERDFAIRVSRQTVWRWLRSQAAVSVPKKKPIHRMKRTRSDRQGELLFLDGSEHRWFGENHPMYTLVLSSDDATSECLWGVFAAEDRNNCFRVLFEIAKKFGLPNAFYLDRASQFITTRHGGLSSDQRPLLTHWQIAMQKLGIRCIFADSPQARGRGERIHGTLQNRLVHEFQFRKITDPIKATRFLNEVFIPEYNQKFGVKPAVPDPAWRKIPKGLDIRTVLCAKYPRQVSNDNTINFESTRYQILKHPGWNFAKTTIEVQEWCDGSTHLYHPKVGLLRAKAIAKRSQRGDKIAATAI